MFAGFLLAAFSWLSVLPATAGAALETVTAGQVTATLTYEVTPDPESPLEPRLSNAQLTITRAGQSAYSREVTSSLPYCVRDYPGQCWPQGARNESPELASQYRSLKALELQPNGEPDVLLRLYSGGAHCCYIDQVFSWNPAASTYEVAERSWGSLAARVADLAHNGQIEFVTGDDRFEYRFASFGFSGFPLQILVLRGGKFVEVTRSYPSQIAADARAEYRRYEHWRSQGLGLGFLAAWVADEYLLGKRQRAMHALAIENRRGHLLEARLAGVKNVGGGYVGKLKRFLRKIGYG
jgi:hypothetical protein